MCLHVSLIDNQGAVAEKWLHESYGTRVVCWVSAVGSVEIPANIAVQLGIN